MELRAGYKQTEVGVIPQDWEVKRIGELAIVGSGGTPSRKNSAYWGGSIPWVTTSQIDFGTIESADQFISELGLQNSAAKLLPKGTLLLALYGQGKTRGKVAMLGFEATTNQACASISLTSNVSREYVLHFLGSRYEALRNASNTGSQENLNGQIVKDFPVVCPPPFEQRAIATALSDVDALLAKIDQLIDKKRDLKQAAMQQLLTGQARLPGFSGEWEVKRLGDLASLYQPETIAQSEFTKDGYRASLRSVITDLLAHWQPKLGVQAAHWGIKRMKTKWGSCNVSARRIWLNLELAKKPVQCLEYIVVHELVHLLERNHTKRFTALMDRHLPDWRTRREVLNSSPLGHEAWGY